VAELDLDLQLLVGLVLRAQERRQLAAAARNRLAVLVGLVRDLEALIVAAARQVFVLIALPQADPQLRRGLAPSCARTCRA